MVKAGTCIVCQYLKENFEAKESAKLKIVKKRMIIKKRTYDL